jgi:hypothetical protein
MKKISIGLLVIAAVVLLLSASVWEGSAAVASSGALPESGYYAATNSFPRNTVVDITNLANGRTIRVIVAGGLETPGLLVVLSKDAAGAIELQSRSIGRVKMSQPADPVAFARFTEGKASSGDPDFDPAAAPGAAPDDPAAPVAAPAAPLTIAPAAAETAEAAETAGVAEIADAAPAAEVAETAGVPTAPAAEVTELPVAAPAAEVAEAAAAPGPAMADPTAPDAAPAAEVAGMPATPVAEVTEVAAAVPAAEVNEVPVAAPAVPLGIAPAPAGTANTAPAIPVSGAAPESGAKEMPVISDTITAVPAPDTRSGAALPDFMRSPQNYEYALEGAGPKVPEAPGLLIDEKDIIAPAPVPDVYEREYFISEAELIPSVDESPLPAKNLPVYNAAPYETIQSETSPAYPEANNFSVPVISDLEKGKYYIQLAALSKVESVENEIKKIDSSLPMAVQGAGSSEKPIYRVLVGPVNLGESGALLRRFKATYKDAFVRVGN